MKHLRNKPSPLYRNRKYGGFSILELLISVFLGSILSWTTVEIYLASVRSFILKTELASIQNNGRIALAELRRELMQVGFFGGKFLLASLKSERISRDCVSSNDWALGIAVPMDFVNDFSTDLETIQGKNFNCLIATDVVEGSDLISLKRTAGDYTVRNGAYASGLSARKNQWYLRLKNTDASASWTYHSTGGLAAADIGADTGIDYWQYSAAIYYIRRYSESVGDQIPSLCAERLGGGLSAGVMATQCIAEGVEDMQFEFGVDSDNDGIANYFAESLGRTELKNVAAVRVFLLLRSITEVPAYKGARTYYLGSKRVSTDDRYVRRVMSATVATINLLSATG